MHAPLWVKKRRIWVKKGLKSALNAKSDVLVLKKGQNWNLEEGGIK